MEIKRENIPIQKIKFAKIKLKKIGESLYET